MITRGICIKYNILALYTLKALTLSSKNIKNLDDMFLFMFNDDFNIKLNKSVQLNLGIGML